MVLPISYTGVRSGEKIIGTWKSNKGSIMEIRGFYPPSREEANGVSSSELYNNIRNLPAFRRLSEEEVITYLEANGTDKNQLYLNDGMTRRGVYPKLYRK